MVTVQLEIYEKKTPEYSMMAKKKEKEKKSMNSVNVL